jgi:ADP-heptose:LPS heptosyltransferase
VSRHVLAVRLDSIGDVLLAGPAIRALATGASEVTLLCGPRGRAAGELLPGVDRLVEFRAPWIDPEPEAVREGDVGALVDSLRELEPDEAVVFTSFHQSPLPTALVLRLAAIPRIAAISVDYPGSLLDVRHSVDEDLHEVERSVSLARAAGFAPADDLGLAIRLDARRESTDPYVVVHPGASVPARAWRPELARDLVGALDAAGHRVCVTGGVDELPLTAFVSSGATGATDLGGRTTLEQLAHVIADASVVVCGNTGAAHLAAAVGTPVVSLYAPTVPAARWRPWGVPHVLLGDQTIACAGCRARRCPVAGHPCLSRVPVSDVVAAVELLVDVCTSPEAELVDMATTRSPA